MPRRARRSRLLAAPAPALASALAIALTSTLGGRADAQSLAGTAPGSLAVPLIPADQCAECHGGARTPDGRAYLPFDTWQTSLMANAVRDPLFRATLTTAEQDSPGIGTYCLRCHTPAGFTAGRATPGDGSALDTLSDYDGVHCDACHRATDQNTGDPNAPYVGDAQLYFDDDPTGASPVRFGPYADPFPSTRHPSAGSAYTTSARLCGGCHDVDNPLVHRRALDGTDTGQPFPLQSTFSEWAQSDFARTGGQTCQDCHMPAESGALPAANFPNAPARDGVRRHDFFGGNEWGMAMLAAARPGELDDQFADARARAQVFLRTAARLEVLDAPAAVNPGDEVRVTVRVTNLTGHKLPTGYEDARVMWLQVLVNGAPVSGDFQNDELVEDAQLRAYRFVPGRIVNGAAVADDFVAHHEVVLEDTRIPPRGMVPDARTMPVGPAGRDYAGGANGALRNDDTVTFALRAPAGGPMVVGVRLLYRATTKHYVEAIAGANHTDARGSELLAAWEAAGRAPPFEMAAQSVTVQVAGAGDAGAGASDAGAGVSDAGRDGGSANAMQGGCGCRAAGGRSGEGSSGVGWAALAALAAWVAGRRGLRLGPRRMRER